MTIDIGYPFEYGTNYHLYTKTKDQIQKLQDVLVEMFDEDENLHQYINCIAVTNRDKRLNIASYKKIMTNQLEMDVTNDEAFNALNFNDNHYGHHKSTFDTISFMNLGSRQLRRLCRNSANRRRSRSGDSISPEERMYKIFNPNIPEPGSISHKIHNIDPELKGITGSTFMNFNGLKDLMLNMYAENNQYKPDNILEYVLVGSRNLLLAVILPSGHLLIKWGIINSLLVHKPEVVKPVLFKLFNRFNYFNDKIQQANMTTSMQNAEDAIFFESYRNILSGLDDEYSFFPSKIDGSNSFRIENILIDQMQKILRDSFNGTVFDVQNESMYKQLLQDIFDNCKNHIKQAKDKAYASGMAMSNKMAMLGWQVVDHTQVPGGGSEGVVWYRKQVDLVPDRYCLEKKIYRIAEDKRDLCKIPNLFISSEGQVKTDGAHPNVSTCHNVCTGDMEKMNFSWTGDKIRDWLRRLESILSMMNFDSPHCSKLKSKVKVGSKLLDAYTTGNSEVEEKKSKAASGLRKLGTPAPQPEEVELEVEDEEEPEEIEVSATSYGDNIDISNNQADAEVIQLYDGQNGNVYNGEEFVNNSVQDPFNDLLPLIDELKDRASSKKWIVKNSTLPKPKNRLRFNMQPYLPEGEFGIYKKGTGCVYYCKWNQYYNGAKMKAEEFDMFLRLFTPQRNLFKDQENISSYAKFLSGEARARYKIPLPQESYEMVGSTMSLDSMANQIHEVVQTEEIDATSSNEVGAV